MPHETTTIAEHQHILRVSLGEGNVAWLLFTEKRKLWQCDDCGGKPATNDVISILVTTLGSFDKSIRAGDRVMEMKGEASSTMHTVNFSNGYIVVEPPWEGLRIGTYMMNRLVAWTKEAYPDYQPVGIKLLALQAQENNKERRNRFYARFGFKFDWADSDQEAGVLTSGLRVCDLNTTDKWQEKVGELSIPEGLKEIFSESQRLRLSKVDAERCRLMAFNERDHAKAEFQLSEARKMRWGLGGFALGITLAMVLAVWVVSH